MLQNETQPDPPILPGQVRVTPEELNQAIAAIEGRRQAEAQRLAGTIPIEEAVTSLHLDATHEEVWAEVQAQRAAAERAEEAARRQQDTQTRTVTPQAMPAEQRRRRPLRRLVVAGVITILWGTALFPQFRHHSHPTPAVTSQLAQIPDGTQIECDTAALVQISEGKPLSQIQVQKGGSDQNRWSLTKMAGHIYLHAYTLPITSLLAQRDKPFVLYNDDNSGDLKGERTSKTTIRVDRVPLQVSGGDDDYTEITVPHFQPDQFTTTSDWR